MEVASIIIFFIMFFLIGVSIKILFKLNLEENVINSCFLFVGLGLGVFVLMANVFNLIKIPLDFRIFLSIGFIIPIYWLIKNRKEIRFTKLKLTKETIYSAVLIFILISYFIFFINGAYKYSYLEDDDSWGNAEAAKYVAIKKEYSAKPRFTHYLEPYPPAYASFMGVIHQTNNSIFYTLKLFNVFLMTLSIAFFYLLTKLFFNRSVALISTIILALIPSFMSHFIWSQTFALAIFIVCFYFVFKFIKEKQKNCFYISSILLASSLNIQTIASAKIGLIFLVLFVSIIFYTYLKKEDKDLIKKIFLIGISGLVLSLLIYWLPAYIHQGQEEFLTIAEGFSIFKSASASTESMAQYANPIYSFKDIIVASTSSKIDQATGIGVFTFICLLVGLFFIFLRFKKTKEALILFLILWLIWEFISLKSGSLPIGLIAQRAWAYLAIPIAVIAGYGVYCFLKSTWKIHFTIPLIVIILLIIGFYYTSYIPKKAVQQAIWPPGVSWTSNEELQGYIQLKELPPDTKVYSGCQPQAMVIGFDKLSFSWIKEIREYKEKIINDGRDENYNFLKKYGYEYFTISSGCAKNYGINETNSKIQEFAKDQRFKIINSNNGYILFGVN